MTPAEILATEQRLAELVEHARVMRYSVEAISRPLAWRYMEAVGLLDEVAAGLAETDDGGRLPGSRYHDQDVQP